MLSGKGLNLILFFFLVVCGGREELQWWFCGVKDLRIALNGGNIVFAPDGVVCRQFTRLPGSTLFLIFNLTIAGSIF